jgi:serine/threonine-protein kinase
MMEAIVGDYERESFVEPDPTVVQGALAPVPDVRGRSQADAERVLRDAGFRAHVADEVPSQHPAGTVVDTQPGPYSQHPSGASIALIISDGSPPPSNGRPGDDDGPGDGPGDGDDDGPGGGNGNGNGDGDELQVPDPADFFD